MGEIHILKDLIKIILYVYPSTYLYIYCDTMYTQSIFANRTFLSREKCLECTLLHKEIIAAIHHSLSVLGN